MMRYVNTATVSTHNAIHGPVHQGLDHRGSGPGGICYSDALMLHAITTIAIVNLMDSCGAPACVNN